MLRSLLRQGRWLGFAESISWPDFNAGTDHGFSSLIIAALMQDDSIFETVFTVLADDIGKRVENASLRQGTETVAPIQGHGYSGSPLSDRLLSPHSPESDRVSGQPPLAFPHADIARFLRQSRVVLRFAQTTLEFFITRSPFVSLSKPTRIRTCCGPVLRSELAVLVDRPLYK